MALARNQKALRNMQQSSAVGLAWCAALLISGCGVPEAGDAPIGAVQQAVGTLKVTACADTSKCTTEVNSPTSSFSEPFAFATKSGSTWEMITTANSPGIVNTPNKLEYGCTRDNYANWRTFQISSTGGGSPGQAGDTTGAYETATTRSWIATLSTPSPGYGLNLFRSLEPCPASGEPTWSQLYYPFFATNGGIDHPALVYDPVFDKKYVAFTWNKTGGSDLGMWMRSANGSWNYWRESNVACGTHCTLCGNMPNDVGAPSASVDVFGNVHIVYADQSIGAGSGKIRHEVFNSNGGGFACLNQQVAGYNSPPTILCPGSCNGTATFPQVGSPPCVRAGPSPTIATDPRDPAIPVTVVVAFSTFVINCGGGGVNSQETQVWRNTSSGVGAFTQTLGSCQNSWVFPRLASANIPGGAIQPFGIFHLHVAAVTLPLNGTIFPYHCRSTNGGSTWPTCTALSGPYNPQPLPGYAPCYAGDYQGAAADPAHNVSFSNWGQPLTLPNPPYAIYGNTDTL